MSTDLCSDVGHLLRHPVLLLEVRRHRGGQVERRRHRRGISNREQEVGWDRHGLRRRRPEHARERSILTGLGLGVGR